MPIPATTPETDHDPCYAPPAPPPEPWSEYLRTTFEDSVYTALVRNKMPWYITKQLADEGYHNSTMLVKRWGTEDRLYANAAASLNITGWPLKNQERVIASLAATWEDLSKLRTIKATMVGKSRAAQTIDDQERTAMEASFLEYTGERAKLRYQGSCNLLGKLNKGAAEGRVENVTTKELVPFQAAPRHNTETNQVRNPDGTVTEVEVQYRKPPTTLDDWVDACRLFYYSLMMVILCHPEHPNLMIPWEQLSDFYEEFLFGPTIAKRHNPPPLGRLVVAERKAWQLVIEKMWNRRPNFTLSAALAEVQGDGLWWINELELNNNNRPTTPYTTPYGKGKGGKGKTKQAGPYTRPWQPHPNNNNHNTSNNKGKGKSKGKQRNDLQQRQNQQYQRNTSRGQQGRQLANQNNNFGRGQNSTQPRLPEDQWRPAPGNSQYCRNFHIYNNCQHGRNCNREHRCPACGKGQHSLALCNSI